MSATKIKNSIKMRQSQLDAAAGDAARTKSVKASIANLEKLLAKEEAREAKEAKPTAKASK